MLKNWSYNETEKKKWKDALDDVGLYDIERLKERAENQAAWVALIKYFNDNAVTGGLATKLAIWYAQYDANKGNSLI